MISPPLVPIRISPSSFVHTLLILVFIEFISFVFIFIFLIVFNLLSHIKTSPSPPPVKNPKSFSFIYKQYNPFLCAFLDLVKAVPEITNKFPLILPQIKYSFKYPQHIIEVSSEPFNPVHFFFFFFFFFSLFFFFFFIFPFLTSNIFTSLTAQQAKDFPFLLKHTPKIFALPPFAVPYNAKLLSLFLLFNL